MHRELTIGALSERSGVNIETIRYYERTDLLPAPPRTQGGHRIYGGDFPQASGVHPPEPRARLRARRDP